MAITKDVMMGKTLRKSFAKQDQILEIPNMLKIQKDSYEWFLREGLREVFRDVDTITDYTGNLELSFLDYSMNEPPKYSVEECKERDATYAKPIKVRVRLHNKETDEIKEQEIFMGDFPLMTNGGTFVINGAERVIVSQIVRSPGVYFGDEVDKTDQHIYSATVIPYRGAWLEYETGSIAGSETADSTSDTSSQRTALFSSGLQRMGAWSSASSRYVAFRCRCAQTNFPRFTCGATCKISSEKMSRETGTARIPDSSFASRRATASRSSSPSACPPSQAQDW